MPVAVRAERRRAVVDVERAQPVEPDRRVDLGDELVDRGRIGDVVARGVEVAGVEADPEPRVAVERLERACASSPIERPIVPPAPAEFSISSQVSPSARVEDLLERGGDALEPGVEPGAEVRADVEDDRVGLDRVRRLERRAQRRDRALVDRVVGGGEVAEVERVADDAADPGLGAARA